VIQKIQIKKLKNNCCGGIGATVDREPTAQSHWIFFSSQSAHLSSFDAWLLERLNIQTKTILC
jgi:hypothetical protein